MAGEFEHDGHAAQKDSKKECNDYLFVGSLLCSAMILLSWIIMSAIVVIGRGSDFGTLAEVSSVLKGQGRVPEYYHAELMGGKLDNGTMCTSLVVPVADTTALTSECPVDDRKWFTYACMCYCACTSVSGRSAETRRALALPCESL